MSPLDTTSQTAMPKVTAHLSISLDGYVAGPNQTREEPLGVRGEDLHLWHLGASDHDADRAMTERILAPRGAYVMGRNMYAPDRGEWGAEMWRGWWGEDPPYHAPVFVLTHYPADPLEMEGGTTFHFVTSFNEAMERALDAAGDDTVTIAGGASAVRQGFRAGVVDEILLSHVPMVLGGGAALFEDLEDVRLRPVEVHPSPYATHVVYDVVKG
jgi:dihydrofolate reductase